MSTNNAIRTALLMKMNHNLAKGIASDETAVSEIVQYPSAVLTLLEDEPTRQAILEETSSTPFVYQVLKEYTPVYPNGTGTTLNERNWQQERILNGIIGRPFAGGFIVSAREDRNNNPFILIDGGAEGDSFQRAADATGIPDSGSDGQMNWNSDDTVVFDTYVDDLEKNDGQYLTLEIMDYIRSQGLLWENWPVFNFIRQIRSENINSYNDWYIPGQNSSNNFGTRTSCEQTATPGSATEGESENADLFWYLLKGMDSGRNYNDSRCYPDWLIPTNQEKFFQADSGVEAFDDYHYWSSTESGASAFGLNFGNGGQNTGTKSTNTYCVRAVRRVYT
jgi:hypothetical protein